jgi:predicted nucleotidyltransferase
MEATLLAELTAELQSFFAARADVESAAIFGSVARGEDGPDSDVDIIVAGMAGELDINARLRPLAGRIGRPINASVYEVDQLRELVVIDSVITEILSGRLIPLKGKLPAV